MNKKLTIRTSIAFLILISLGSWQLYRLNWKLGIINKLEEKISKPPISLNEYLKNNKIKFPEDEYMIVETEGEFLHDEEKHLYTGPKVLHGDIGYNIFTPLKLSNNQIILVDRGWVPADKKDKSKREQTIKLEKSGKFIAMLHKSEQRAFFTPDNDVKDNLWFYMDVNQALENFAKSSTENTDYFFVRVLKEKTDNHALPIAGDRKFQIRNDHLGYAITWYLLALILVVVFLIFRNQKKTAN